MQVMEALWALGEGTVYDVLEQFPARRRPKYTTVLTVLRTLEQKGLAAHRTQERTYVFRPAVERQELRRSVLQDVLGRVFAGSPKDLVAALLDVDEVTPEVLAEMKALIAAREGVTSDE
jgi:predicted transcriptional regulator